MMLQRVAKLTFETNNTFKKGLCYIMPVCQTVTVNVFDA